MGFDLSILKKHERDYVANVFKLVKNDVRIQFFTQAHEDQSSRETREILEEVSAISDKIHFNIYDFEKDADQAAAYGIDKLPATVIEGKSDFGIRHFGVPSGYLVSSLVEGIVQISKNESDLSEASRKKLAAISTPVSIQVFVTPNSPYCPTLVNISQRMAIENNHISAHAIDMTRFPHLAMRYNVVDVPFTVINNQISIAGALNESDFIDRVLEAIGRN